MNAGVIPVVVDETAADIIRALFESFARAASLINLLNDLLAQSDLEPATLILFSSVRHDVLLSTTKSVFGDVRENPEALFLPLLLWCCHLLLSHVQIQKRKPHT